VIPDWVVAVLVVAATAAVAVAVLVRAARPWDLGDVSSGRVDPERVQREALRQDREDLEFAAIERYYATGEHDVLPEVDDLWRETAYAYLERMWALPAKERAS
jgi:hypothetical protein